MSGYMSLGKYDNARDDALHYLCTSDWSNGEFGNMEWGGYWWKITNETADVQQSNGEFNSVMDYWFSINPEVEDDSAFRADLVGRFIVIQSDSGMVSVVKFDTEEELNARFNEAQDAFNKWDTDEHGDY